MEKGANEVPSREKAGFENYQVPQLQSSEWHAGHAESWEGGPRGKGAHAEAGGVGCVPSALSMSAPEGPADVAGVLRVTRLAVAVMTSCTRWRKVGRGVP